jgi:hypothetical protein
MQMRKLFTHIIIVQIMIDNVQLHFTIYKHEMDLKLYTLTFKVRKCTTKTFFEMFIFIEI